MNTKYDKLDIAFKVLVILILGFQLIGSSDSEQSFKMKEARLIKDDNSISDVKLMKKNVCYQGFKSIVDRSPSKDFVRTSIVEHLNSGGYREFEIDSSDYIHVELTSNAICRAILKNNNGEYKAFDVEIAKSHAYPFLYFVYDVNEREYKGDS